MISTPRSGETFEHGFGKNNLLGRGGGRKFIIVFICILLPNMISYSTLRVHSEIKKKFVTDK